MSNELEVKKEVGLPSVNLADLMGDAGKGFENVTAKDVAIPFLNILQSSSDQVEKGNPLRIPGAEAGDFFISVGSQVFKGDKGIRVVPVGYQKKWVEWITQEQGGGFVKQWDTEAVLLNTRKDDKNRDITREGHQIVETAYHYVIILNEDGGYQKVVIPMKSTQLKKSRSWNTVMGNLQMTGEGGRKFNPPTFAFSYIMTTIGESNKSGSWQGYKIDNDKLIAFDMPEVYQVAKKFSDEIKAGMVKIQEPVDDGVPATPAANETNF